MRHEYRFIRADPGFCRVYYRGPGKRVFAVADDGGWGIRKIVFYVCSKDGEPSHEVPMPAIDKFDKYIEP